MQVPVKRPLPSQAFFRVGEVAEIIGVAPSTIRYWRGRFFVHIRPDRSSGFQSVFSRRHVAVLALIRHLLHDQKLSIAQAQERLATLLAENGGDVGFVELVPVDQVERERLRNALAEAERRAEEAMGQVEVLRAALVQARKLVLAIHNEVMTKQPSS